MDSIAARLRPRSKWEAADLGFALVREWWQPMLIAWLVASLPVVLLVAGIAFLPPLLTGSELHGEFADAEIFSTSTIALLVLWWLKPLFERAPLYVLGEAMFGQVPTLRQIIRAMPKLFWNNGIFASLTWRRLNPGRTFDFPIRQLEGSKGKFAAQRRRALNPYGWSVAATSAWVLIHVEIVLLLAAGMVLNMFWIGEGPFSFGFDLANPENKLQQDIAYFFLYFLVLTFLELFFVAIGFALYLNARNSLEGWDIELAFRKLRARIDSAPRKHTHAPPAVDGAVSDTTSGNTSNSKVLSVGLTICLGIVSAFSYSSDVLAVDKPLPLIAAAEATQNELRQKAARARNEVRCAALGLELKPEVSTGEVVADVDEDDTSACVDGTAAIDTLKSPVNRASSNTSSTFENALNGQTREARQDAVDALESDSRMGSSRENSRLRYVGPRWESEKKKEKQPDLGWLTSGIGYLAEAFKYLGWAALIVLVTYLIYRALKNAGWLELRRARAALPETLFGLDVRPESLPDDVPAAARALLQSGDVRGALALVYRASLIFLLQDGKIEIATGDTEGECLRRVQAGYSDKPSFSTMMRGLFNAWLWVAYKRAPLAMAECEQLITNWQAEMQFVRAANLAQTAKGDGRG